MATLSLVAALALRLSRRPQPPQDRRCWTRRGSCSPRRRAGSLLNRLVRLGRALNATVLLATQRLADLGDLSELVGVYFLFGQDRRRGASGRSRMIGLDPDDGGAARAADANTARASA